MTDKLKGYAWREPVLFIECPYCNDVALEEGPLPSTGDIFECVKCNKSFEVEFND